MLSHSFASWYPDDIYALVRQIAAMPGFERVREQVAGILWNDWPKWEDVTPDFPKVRAKLEAVRESLLSAPGQATAG